MEIHAEDIVAASVTIAPVSNGELNRFTGKTGMSKLGNVMAELGWSMTHDFCSSWYKNLGDVVSLFECHWY